MRENREREDEIETAISMRCGRIFQARLESSNTWKMITAPLDGFSMGVDAVINGAREGLSSMPRDAAAAATPVKYALERRRIVARVQQQRGHSIRKHAGGRKKVHPCIAGTHAAAQVRRRQWQRQRLGQGCGL